MDDTSLKACCQNKYNKSKNISCEYTYIFVYRYIKRKLEGKKLQKEMSNMVKLYKLLKLPFYLTWFYMLLIDILYQLICG